MFKLLHRFYDLSSGGAEVVVLNMVRALPDQQHVVVFNHYYQTWLSHALRQQRHVKLYRVQGRDITRVLEREAPDRLLFHYYPPMSGEDFARLPPEARSRTILYNHWFTELPWVEDVWKYCFLSPDSLSATGGRIPPQSRHVILNPVAPGYFDVRRQDRSPFTVGRHSRAAPLKFSQDFFELYEQLAIDRLQVCVLGCPPALVGAIESRVHQLRHNYWLLPFNSMRVERFLSFLDLYVYKTHDRCRETCPLNVLEALAAGIPVVAENRGGIRDLVLSAETGFLCDSLADYKQGVEELHRDDALRQRFGLRAREWARAHAGLDVFRRQLLALLEC